MAAKGANKLQGNPQSDPQNKEDLRLLGSGRKFYTTRFNPAWHT